LYIPTHSQFLFTGEGRPYAFILFTFRAEQHRSN